MKKIIGVVIAGALSIQLAGIAVAASTYDPRIQKREQNQEKRIDQGVNNGRLTPAEAAALDAQQAKIRQDEATMKADGKLTPAERRKLRQEQNKAGRDITTKKNIDPMVKAREKKQEKRIDQGINSGRLTPAEAAALDAQQAKIRQDEAAMKADGKLTPAERRKLRQDQNKASRVIREKKHNDIEAR